MKKIFSLLLAFTIIFSFYACGDSNLTVYSVGNSVESDILKLTLDNAQFAIKLNSSSSATYAQMKAGKVTLSEEYFTAEEYDPSMDAGLAYVAPKGHTYVAIEFKAENLDRSSVSHGHDFVSVEYNEEKYEDLEVNYGCSSINGYKWENYDMSGFSLLAGETEYFRAYVDIPVDVDSLDDEFNLIFSIPNSKGDVEKFKYHISGEIIAEQEISLDEAIYKFKNEEGQTFFKEHLTEYTAVSGDEIASLLSGKTWNIIMKLSYGSWEGKFKFESDSRIKETLYDGSVGFFNERTWSVDGNNLILDKEDICEVYKISDEVCLLVKDKEPFAVLY